jgi:transposase InsO family protein
MTPAPALTPALAPTPTLVLAPAPAPAPAPASRPVIPNEEIVVNHLKNWLPNDLVVEGPPRRGFAGQCAERERERVVRQHVVAAGERLFEQGWTWTETSRLLGLAERTLRTWRFDLARPDGRVLPLGRPILGATREQRNEVIHLIHELGPGIDLRSLRESFPALSRAELDHVLHRYRRVWQRCHRQPICQLHWARPGAVWAMDFHGPRPPIDGLYPHLFAVRDLASGQQLLWSPVADVTSATVRAALTSLFINHGAPLVLKSDNGSAFIADDLRQLMENFGVKMLFSPARTPSYNGSIEAGIGSLTTRTEQHAARHGHPGHWTWDDAEAARLEANATARPKGPDGPNPDDRWSARTPIVCHERTLFAQTTERDARDIAAAQGWPPDNASRRGQDREAISQALIRLGYLNIARRSIPLPIPSKKAASIT